MWRVGGGIWDRGSPVRGGLDDDGCLEYWLGLAVEWVEVGFVRANGGRAVAVLFEMGEDGSLVGSRATEREFVLDDRRLVFDSGDFARVGEEGGSGGAEVPRVVSHDRSFVPPAGPGLPDRRGDGLFDGERAEFFRGEGCVGVAARTVEGDGASGDSGRRKGDARGELKDSGAGRSGDDGLD